MASVIGTLLGGAEHGKSSSVCARHQFHRRLDSRRSQFASRSWPGEYMVSGWPWIIGKRLNARKYTLNDSGRLSCPHHYFRTFRVRRAFIGFHLKVRQSLSTAHDLGNSLEAALHDIAALSEPGGNTPEWRWRCRIISEYPSASPPTPAPTATRSARSSPDPRHSPD